MRGEGLAERFAGAVEAQFHGLGGGIGDGGNLLVAEVLVGGQDEGFPEIFGKGGDGFLQGSEFFAGGGALVRICGGVGGGVLGEVGGVSEGFGVAGGPAVVIAGKVGGDGEDPGGEGLPGIVAGAVAVKADEGFLGEVAGGGGICAHADDEADEAITPPAHDGVHGGVVSSGEFRHLKFVLVVAGGLHWLSGCGDGGAGGRGRERLSRRR